MAAVNVPLSIEQGATFEFGMRWDAAADTPRDLTGWSVRMQIRVSQKSPVLLEASTTNGKVTLGKSYLDSAAPVSPANGWIYLKFTDEDTDVLTSRSAVYDLEAESPTGDVFRLIEGRVTVSPNITQDADDPAVGG